MPRYENHYTVVNYGIIEFFMALIFVPLFLVSQAMIMPFMLIYFALINLEPLTSLTLNVMRESIQVILTGDLFSFLSNIIGITAMLAKATLSLSIALVLFPVTTAATILQTTSYIFFSPRITEMLESSLRVPLALFRMIDDRLYEYWIEMFYGAEDILNDGDAMEIFFVPVHNSVNGTISIANVLASTAYDAVARMFVFIRNSCASFISTSEPASHPPESVSYPPLDTDANTNEIVSFLPLDQTSALSPLLENKAPLVYSTGNNPENNFDIQRGSEKPSSVTEKISPKLHANSF